MTERAIYCGVCLRAIRGNRQASYGGIAYHATCLKHLFGTDTFPHTDITHESTLKIAADMAGKMSVSGYQEKISLKLTDDRKALIPAPANGRYILKPQIQFPCTPENEHLTMRLASILDIVISECALIRLKDGELAYIIKRFDRLDDGIKLPFEDFCQLGGLPPQEKYGHNAFLGIEILQHYATEPVIAIFNYFRQLLFSYCVANGDAHLKNFGLLRQPDGASRLSPAYDLLNTQLALGDQKFSLAVEGSDGPIRRAKWLSLAQRANIPPKAAEAALQRQIDAETEMINMVQVSFLPDDLKEKYKRHIHERINDIRLPK